MASLEYGVAVLGIPLILVMGHSNCGAVKASMGGKLPTPQRHPEEHHRG
jgi:carbonic anhydrase